MKLATAVGVLAAAGALAGCGSSSRASATSASTPRPVPARARCAPRGARVLAASRQAEVYTSPHPVPGPGGAARPGVAVGACLTGVQRPVELGTAAAVQRATLTGTTAAYATIEPRGIDTIATTIVVASVHRGRAWFEVPAGRIAIAPSSVTVDALAVTADGTVAWIQHGGTDEDPGYSVHAASAAKPTDRQLAASPAIQPRSLRLSRGEVSWTEGATRRTAPI